MEFPSNTTIEAFVAESNRIEGIYSVKTREVSAFLAFLGDRDISVGSLTCLVRVFQPDAVLRSEEGLDVRVADHLPPRGGPDVTRRLVELLEEAKKGLRDPWSVHVEFQRLHPFTDGNGRGGRALWAWQQLRQGRAPGRYALSLGFLHQFYYDTLARNDYLAMRVAVLEHQLNMNSDEASGD